MLRYKVIEDLGGVLGNSKYYYIYYKKHWWSPWEYFGLANTWEEMYQLLNTLKAYGERYRTVEEGKC